jgi:hypothetical protein
LESKPFASHQSGGTGFILSTAANNRNLTFLPNLNSSSSSNWVWLNTEVYPEDGKYYHVVGVWDKTENKAMTYINGVLEVSVDLEDKTTYVPSTYKWFCVGGDADNNRAGNIWRGDVVIARVYDEPLSTDYVSDLWDLVKDATNAANTGINTPKPSAGFSIYPNPASEVVNIDLTQVAGDVPVRIYTAQGVKVLEQTLSGGSVQTVSLSGLAPAAYTVKVNGSAYKLIVK